MITEEQYGEIEAQTGYTQEALEAMFQAGVVPDEVKLIMKQYEQASAMRDAPGPQGRAAGNVYMAANPLEHIGAGVQKYRAGRQKQDAQQQHAEAMRRMAEGRMQGIPQQGGPVQGTPITPQERQADFMRKYEPPRSYSA